MNSLSAPGVALPTPKFQIGQRVIWRDRYFVVQDGDCQYPYTSIADLISDGWNGVSEAWATGLGLVAERHYPERWEILDLTASPEWMYSIEIDEEYDWGCEGWFDESNLIGLEPALKTLVRLPSYRSAKNVSADLTDIAPVLRPFVIPTGLQVDRIPGSTFKLYNPEKHV